MRLVVAGRHHVRDAIWVCKYLLHTTALTSCCRYPPFYAEEPRQTCQNVLYWKAAQSAQLYKYVTPLRYSVCCQETLNLEPEGGPPGARTGSHMTGNVTVISLLSQHRAAPMPHVMMTIVLHIPGAVSEVAQDLIRCGSFELKQ